MEARSHINWFGFAYCGVWIEWIVQKLLGQQVGFGVWDCLSEYNLCHQILNDLN
jgi:hypothetical protein